MKILDLDLKNIGPFDEAHLDFRERPGSDDTDVVPVTIVTGENGTGKSIIIDAIRGLFGRDFVQLERDIRRSGLDSVNRAKFYDGRSFFITGTRLGSDRTGFADRSQGSPWIVDYWQSSLSNDSFIISGFSTPNHSQYLHGSLQGHHQNASTTALICHIDYLRDSRDPTEKRYGEILYKAVEAIASVSLIDGSLDHVARTRLLPMFKQRGQLLSIEKLSAGSLYLIQRMLGVLGRMYSSHIHHNLEGDDLLSIPGLLLIDEAENHLHPKWQKRLIPTIRKIFPNLQIIVATHSPFIVASVDHARVYVCRAEPDRCVVEDVSATYVNLPINEILTSPAFAGTWPFSDQITELLDRRKAAIEAGDAQARQQIEAELLDRNREYFDYFNLDTLLKQVNGGAGE